MRLTSTRETVAQTPLWKLFDCDRPRSARTTPRTSTTRKNNAKMRASTRFLALAVIAVALLGSATAMEFDLVDRCAPDASSR